MRFEEYLEKHMSMHPSMREQDVVKLCYQAACGAGHMLADIDAAREYFKQEYESIQPCDTVLCEYISDSVCRVNLAAWKFRKLPQEQLFSIFEASAREMKCDKAKLSDFLKRAERVLLKTQALFAGETWKRYVSEYVKKGMPAVHHSDTYRECERPAYRIVSSRYMEKINLLHGFEQKQKI